jgi:UDP-N-acetylmuramoyl-tripeptide--D-alanyl-D-alanine ligase
VPNTLTALGQIANQWRRQYAIPLIGVTGSNGKTTVKEMIASILAAAFGEEARLATQGNLNNEIGVPLTLMRLEASHRAAVVELGMNHPGEIAAWPRSPQPTGGDGEQRPARAPGIHAHRGSGGAGKRFRLRRAAGRRRGRVSGRRHLYGAVAGLASHCRSITFGLGEACDVRATYVSTGFGNNLKVTVPGGDVRR